MLPYELSLIGKMGHIRREGNKVAHNLANLALQDHMERVWLYDPPDCIRDLLHAETLALQFST